MADEVKNLSKYRKAQKTFGKIFLISFAVFFVFLLLSSLYFFNSNESPTFSGSSPSNSNTSAPSSNMPASNKPADSDVPKPYPSRQSTQPTKAPPISVPVSGNKSNFPFFVTAVVVVGMVSFFAAACALLGFLTMTIVAWKKEKHEAATFRIESQKKQFEIETLKAELQKSKTPTSSAIYKKCLACSRNYEDTSLNYCLNDGAVLSEVYDSKDFGQNPFEKTQVMENNIPTERISAETEEFKNKNTAK